MAGSKFACAGGLDDLKYLMALLATKNLWLAYKISNKISMISSRKKCL